MSAASLPAVGQTVVYRKRRNVELAMVLLACTLGLGGWLLTEINLHGHAPTSWMRVSALWIGMAVACHLVVRWRLPYADPLILPCVIALNGLGLAMIHRIDLIPSPPRDDAVMQFVWTGLGMLLFAAVAIFVRDPRRLQRFPYLLFIAGVGLLLLPLVPGLGVSTLGANIWIRIGPMSFQPSEVAKILLAFAFAAYLVDKREVLALSGFRLGPIQFPRLRDLGPIALMWVACMLVLVFQNDLGTALLFFGLFVIMLYVATERPGWPIVGAALMAVGGWGAYLFTRHVRVRVSSWLHPFENYDQNLQVISGQFGMAWGGLTGRGWGLGRPGLTPLAKSDFISAAIGEEVGLFGLVAVVMLYAYIVARGLRMALASHDPYLKLLACGLSFTFALQVFAIIGGVTRLLPLTGLTTPFMSQGGSSMIANWTIIGVMLVISHHARRPMVATARLDEPTATDLRLDETHVITAKPLPASGVTA
ncbi:FtsW/RodA/SpoVE family cell cycle protein [Aestuariimicrobium sp. T2.26MG-19.2B]|uniref:FtsW/RodA/SpoVE family cell cycle protein n=1 Tax=Aestuariimicrobium sp. T2.26MG-19.2B TaxID=3040679 RepID=UPI002477B757|nr:FtsW/RodA/SpoVE family cell cycle protein [Aestuariimicrobium sp. T2.26MG-19.2B]CAI9404668.1 putative FtsW-like protein [Aestuariimicrobium sp. T2.26MG-19.2B]